MSRLVHIYTTYVLQGGKYGTHDIIFLCFLRVSLIMNVYEVNHDRRMHSDRKNRYDIKLAFIGTL